MTAFGSRAIAVAVGLSIVAVGYWLFRFGGPLITALNRDYLKLPGRFQYPTWSHRLLGSIFISIGVLIAVIGIVPTP